MLGGFQYSEKPLGGAWGAWQEAVPACYLCDKLLCFINCFLELKCREKNHCGFACTAAGVSIKVSSIAVVSVCS